LIPLFVACVEACYVDTEIC